MSGLIGWCILVLLAAFAAVLCVRAALCRPAAEDKRAKQPAEVDGAAAVEHLAQLVRIPTVSDHDWTRVDDAQFAQLRARLAQLYPRVHAACPPVLCGNTGLLFCWKGRSGAQPTVLMAHYDVVPVEAGAWSHPPFCGEVIDGELWGRGTLDTKITLTGILEAAEQLLGEGFVPANDIYFAFAGDEEVEGHGAQDIIAWLQQHGIRPAMVVDEGGAVVDGTFPGVKQPVAAVGIGEKGVLSAELVAHSEGGHASHPTRPSAIGTLSRAVLACENHPFPAHITPPARAMLRTLAPYTPFGLRIVLANLWCFGGLFCALSEKLGSELNAMMRTTMAFTMARGSKQINVMPSEAAAGVNLRLLNDDSPEDAAAYLRRRAGEKVEVRVLYEQKASPYASTTGAHWDLLARAIADTWDGCLVSPYLMIACSDSRHYAGFCDDVYKFSAMHLTTEQRGLIHNNDERIPLAEVARTVEFFVRLEQSL